MVLSWGGEMCSFLCLYIFAIPSYAQVNRSDPKHLNCHFTEIPNIARMMKIVMTR